MVNQVKFYNHNGDLSFIVPEQDILSIIFANTVNGSANGMLDLVMTTSNGLLNAAQSMRENSHFVIIDLDGGNENASGGIIETPVISNGTITIPFVGFIEYLDKQTFVTNYHSQEMYQAMLEEHNLQIKDDDESWRMTFYAQSPPALIEAILDNQALAITAFNRYVPWKISGIDYGYEQVGFEEQRELDTLNLPTIGTEITEILETSLPTEQEMLVKVNSENDKFYWDVVFTDTTEYLDLYENNREFSSFTIDYQEIENRAIGIGKTEKLNGTISLGIVANEWNDAAFTMTIPDDTENTFTNPRKIIKNKLRNKDNHIGQMSYETDVYSVGNVLDRVQVTLANNEVHQGIITEISYKTEDQLYKVTANVTKNNTLKLYTQKPRRFGSIDVAEVARKNNKISRRKNMGGDKSKWL